ncbi:MAG TPA: S9 family peptidase [Steroidobacteraceae bacterium]
MRWVTIAFAILATPTAIGAGSPQADELTATVTRMARVGSCFSPSFSPDGQHLAVVCDMSGTPQVWTTPAIGGWPTQVTALEDPVTRVEWSPAGNWLAISVAPGGGMNTQIYLVHPDGSGLKRYSQGGKDNNWLSRWTRGGSALMVSSNVRAGAAMDPYMLDVDNGEMRLVSHSPGMDNFIDASRDNHVALVQRMQSRGNNNVYWIDVIGHTETNLTAHEGPGTFDGRLSPDGHTVYLISNKDRDLTAFAKEHVGAHGEAGVIEIVAQRTDADLAELEINADGTEAALVWNVAGRSELAFVNLKTGQSTPGPKLPSEIAFHPRYSPDGHRVAVVLTGSTAPEDIWVIDRPGGHLRQVTFSPHPGVNLAELVHATLVHYKGLDGEPLTAWLWLPKKWQAPGPCVLSFHGGPEGQELPDFRSDYQALLGEGIAVLAPNVRGSGGFGKRFVNLDNQELRFNGIKDIKASVDYLTTNMIADPKRLGIMGGSYGGYMTMAGLTEYPTLFRAGADLYGVVNFETFFAHTEPWMAAISTIEYGDPKTQGELLKQLSPINKIERVQAATLVLHGANDTNVPVVEAQQVVDDLKRRGVPVELIMFPDEGHGWRKMVNRVRSTVEVTRWFVKYLGPGAPMDNK